MDRARADYMGMLGTVMNCLALQDFLEKAGVTTRVQTAITMGQVAEPYIPRRAIRHLEKGRVVIFGAGAGMPYFSTDTVAAQRALETAARVLLGKNGVDGVYSADPRTDPDADRLEQITYDDVLAARARRSPTPPRSACAATTRCRSSSSVSRRGHIARVVRGEKIGTLVSAASRPKRDEPTVIDEILFEAEEKMEKAVHVARKDFSAGCAPAGRTQRVRPSRRRLLRRAHADPADGHGQRPRGAHGGDQALRREVS